jgi:hypothetical protein
MSGLRERDVRWAERVILKHRAAMWKRWLRRWVFNEIDTLHA